MREKLQKYIKLKQEVQNRDYSVQHRKNRLSAIERVQLLFDPGSFVEIGILAKQDVVGKSVKEEPTPRDGIVTGYGLINGRLAGVAAYDITVKGGSMGFVGEKKFNRVKELALEQGFPIIIMCDGTGARLEEEISSRMLYDNPQFKNLCALSGYVPIVVAVMGECFGGHANLTALGDFVPMTKGSTMGLVGPPLLKSKMSIEISKEELGGVKVHCEKSGMADLEVQDDHECIAMIKKFLSYLPSNCHEEPPQFESSDDPERKEDSLLDIVPVNPKRAYDMHRVIDLVVDKGSFFELKPKFAKNIITGLARMDGRSVGIIANQPMVLAGAIDSFAANKASHFIEFCDAFGIPLIFFQDVPGFLPGPQSELAGIIRYSTKMIYTLAHSTVPKISILIRKVYGLAHYGMCNRGFNPNLILAWPTVEASAIDPEDAVDIMFGKTLSKSPDWEQIRRKKIDELRNKISIDEALEAGLIDDVIDPRETRSIIIKALRMAKRRQQGFNFKHHGISPI